MSINKKILALAIAGALPGASYAFVDLQAVPATPAVFAEEITPVPGTILDNGGRTAETVGPNDAPATGALGVKTKLGFSIVGSSKYVRLDFPDTKLKQALTAENFRTIGTTPANITVSNGGGVDSNFVIVELSGANLSQDDLFYFEPPAAVLPSTVPVTLEPQSKTVHTVLYRLFSNPADAVNQTPGAALATFSGPWYQFGPGLDVSCNTTGVSVRQIDPVTPTQFVGGLPNLTPFFNLVVQRKAPTVLDVNGVGILISKYLPAGSTFKVAGDFNFVSSMVTTAGDPIDVPTKTWTVGTPGAGKIVVPDPSGFGTEGVTLGVNGTTPMTAGDYSIVVTPGTGALNTAPIDLGICGRLRFAGSTDRVDFGLTPGSTNKQFFRITNPSSTDGAVGLTVWNDAGKQVDFPLSLVKVGPAPGVNLSAVLNKQSSTPLIDVNAVYAAAVAKDGTFVVGTGADGKLGKLRIEARGAFGEKIISGIIPENPVTLRFKDGIHIQAVNTSSTFQVAPSN